MLFELFELSPVKVESRDSVDCEGGNDSEQLSLSAVVPPRPLGKWPFWGLLLAVDAVVAEVDVCELDADSTAVAVSAAAAAADRVDAEAVEGSEVVQS